MHTIKRIAFVMITLLSVTANAQLGFCSGSKGDAIFSENFGNGTNYGPALPAGTTTYNFVTGTPNDGNYTLFWRTFFNENWHNSLDHTPDATNGLNGKMLIVNAASTAGEFYKRTVTGLCEGTTFEFSAWVMNGYNPSPPGNPGGFCGTSQIPINVRFEIWNGSDTVLLASGNTGNIFGTPAPLWQQFALVFTMPAGETSAVLRMKNNGAGGCGNDLAIDDIEFRACGDLTTISSPQATGSTYQVCQNQTPITVNLLATTTGTTSYAYQWQSSSDGVVWNSIAGANGLNFTASNITATTYFRAKVAQNVANLNNDFCSTISNVFTVTLSAAPSAVVSSGNQSICGNEPIPTLTVSTDATTGVNWYSAATGGVLLQANSNSYTPTMAGTYYAEGFHLTSNCVSSVRTAVTLTIAGSLTASVSSVASVCAGATATVNFSGSPNAIVNYTVDSGPLQTITLNSSGTNSVTTLPLTASTTFTLVSTSTSTGTCLTNLSATVTINISAAPTASITGSVSVCSGASGTVTFTGSPANAIVSYTVNNGPVQTVPLVAGTRTINTANLTATATYTLVSVSTGGAAPCIQSLVGELPLTIGVIPLPTATIAANPSAVCLNGTTTLAFNGTPNAEISYRAVGGAIQTITLNASGVNSIAVTNIMGPTTYQLVSALLTGSNCSQAITGSAAITINQTPTASFSGSVAYCSGETTAITLSSDVVGTTFSWTVSENQTTGATAGNGTIINQTLTASQTDALVTYEVTPFFNGCAGLPISIAVVVYALPNPILGNGVVCLNSGSTTASQGYVLDTNLNSTDYSFEWFYETDLIPTALGSTYEAFQLGNYTVIATHLVTGCVSNPVTATISETEQGQSLEIIQSEAFSNNNTVTINVIGGSGPFLYQLGDSDFQSSNIFTDITSGTYTIRVIDEVFCTNLTAEVTVLNYPKFFTPNGDGINDVWAINGLTGNFELLIFDRYGKLIKQILPNTSGWDGTFNGVPLFASDYWFVLDYAENGVQKTFKAHFSLKR